MTTSTVSELDAPAMDDVPRGEAAPGSVSRWAFSFPDTVDEHAARLVATGVVLMGLGSLFVSQWILVPLAVGFALRVGWGPRLSPLARLVTRRLVGNVVPTGNQVAGGRMEVSRRCSAQGGMWRRRWAWKVSCGPGTRWRNAWKKC